MAAFAISYFDLSFAAHAQDVVLGHRASVNLIAAEVMGTDPKVSAGIIRGAIMEIWPAESFRTINIPVLILNDKADVANQKLGAF